MTAPTLTRIPSDLLLALADALKLLPNAKPRAAARLLKKIRDYFENEMVNAIVGHEPWAEERGYEPELDSNGAPVYHLPDPRQYEFGSGLIVTAADIKGCFSGKNWARVTPAGAALILRLYEAGVFERQRPRAGLGDPTELRTYSTSHSNLLAQAFRREEEQRARAERIKHPERISEAEFSYGLLNEVFITHHGLRGGIIGMTIGGLVVSKNVTTYKSNSGKSRDSDVIFSWTSPDGTERHIHKESQFAGNRRNDEDRTWGLGRE